LLMESTLWHPVASDDPQVAGPLAVTVLGQSVVLWRDEHGQAHAWADQCPHRGARLSLGQVTTGPCGSRRLACPYHGWAFEAGGRCVHVPAQPDWTPPASHAVRRHEVCAHAGLLWVRLTEPGAPLPPELLQPPAFAPAGDPAWRQLLCGPYAVGTSAPRLVENFLDMSHFGFVHEGWLGDADHAQVDVGQVEETAHGLVASQCRAWQPRAYASATQGQMVAYRYHVPAPFTAMLHKDATTPDGTRNAIALFINPVGPEDCVAWFVMATQNDPTSDSDLRAFQDAVFAQDRPVVESQMPRRLPIATGPVPPGATREVHGPADRLSSAYRRYLARLGVTVGTC